MLYFVKSSFFSRSFFSSFFYRRDIILDLFKAADS